MILVEEDSLKALITDCINNALKSYSISSQKDIQTGEELPIGVAEAASVTNLSKQTIYKLVCQRKIPYYKSKERGKLYFRKNELLDWLKK